MRFLKGVLGAQGSEALGSREDAACDLRHFVVEHETEGEMSHLCWVYETQDWK